VRNSPVPHPRSAAYVAGARGYSSTSSSDWLYSAHLNIAGAVHTGRSAIAIGTSPNASAGSPARKRCYTRSYSGTRRGQRVWKFILVPYGLELEAEDVGDCVGDDLSMTRASSGTLFDLDTVCSSGSEPVDDVLQAITAKLLVWRRNVHCHARAGDNPFDGVLDLLLQIHWRARRSGCRRGFRGRQTHGRQRHR
jgi:hypothetical protein